MKKIIIISLLLVSCQPEPIEPNTNTCNCYERHEWLNSNFGTFTWELDYSTDTIPSDCNTDTGNWTYTNNDTKRYRVICQ